MTKTGKISSVIAGIFLLLVVVAIVVIATFDWNRLKPTINQKVSAELNRPFAIRGDLGVVWERNKDESGWRSWVPWPHVHAEDILLGNPPEIPRSDHGSSAKGGCDACAALAAHQKRSTSPGLKLVEPDARIIRLSEKK
ncbi:Uncharacterized protein involved in outer membrane biogenesis [Cedecea neteri]|uniref:Uncharacterized protein involved in outer membrane biogenesis n=1 Tax=Cedecea neteri TaxID=158822 RepID=A0A2X2TDP0_9ENTR|nr:Uncharacterized protein involved in outer membrane biogenesis [Cedecea neteri]